jgi:hypothetical protein
MTRTVHRLAEQATIQDLVECLTANSVVLTHLSTRGAKCVARVKMEIRGTGIIAQGAITYEGIGANPAQAINWALDRVPT